MDATTLAKKMLEFEELQGRADALRTEIEAAVLEMGESQQVGRVKATYYSGRKSYDYEGAVNQAMQTGNYPNEILDPYTKTVVKTDYRKAALEGLSIPMDGIPYTESAPSARIKLT